MPSTTWRPMRDADIGAAHALSEIVHPGHPETRAVFAERLALCPEGCFVLDGEDGLAGYALSHPYVRDAAPALDTLLGALPAHCDVYYIHDIAILPHARGRGAGAAIVSLLKQHARDAGFDTICLVAVNSSAPFWQRHGFAVRKVAGMREKLGSYGEGAMYMSGVSSF